MTKAAATLSFSANATATPGFAKLVAFVRSIFARRRYDIAYAILFAAFALALLFPIKTRLERELSLLLAAACWILPWLAFRRKIVVGVIWIPVTAAAIFLFAGPTPKTAVQIPRSVVVQNLKAYMGTPYIWGGEARLGIDCSGLVRRGTIDACYQQGINSHDPRLMRIATSIWWHDVSADELGQGYDGRTIHLFDTKSLNDADYSRLSPGDFAVTSSGLHTLAYVGNRTWIEADPLYMRVVKISAPSNSPWFSQSMRIMRWTYVQ